MEWYLNEIIIGLWWIQTIILNHWLKICFHMCVYIKDLPYLRSALNLKCISEKFAFYFLFKMFPYGFKFVKFFQINVYDMFDTSPLSQKN